VVLWFEDGVLSQQPGFDSCQGKTLDKKTKDHRCAFNEINSQGVLKKRWNPFPENQ